MIAILTNTTIFEFWRYDSFDSTSVLLQLCSLLYSTTQLIMNLKSIVVPIIINHSDFNELGNKWLILPAFKSKCKMNTIANLTFNRTSFKSGLMRNGF